MTADAATPAINVRLASSDVEREAVYALRYAIYIDEMKRNQRYADHERKRIQEPLDADGHVFAAFQGDAIVGTVRVNCGDDGTFGEYVDYYQMERFGPYFPKHCAIVTKLMVTKDQREDGVTAVRLAQACMRLCYQHNIEFGFIDCNDYLITYFESLGFRRYMGETIHPEYGVVCPMVMVMNDIEHLASINSKLYLDSERRKPSPVVISYFAETHLNTLAL